MPRSKQLDQEINAEHAERMLETLTEHIEISYERTEEMLTQALSVLRHYADVHHLRFHKALDASYDLYLEEKKGA